MKHSKGFNIDNDILSFIPSLPTENMRGGIKANARTNEEFELVIDNKTEKGYIGINDSTEEKHGLMSKEDKKKLNHLPDEWEGIDFIEGSKVIQDENNRLVTDEEKSFWTAKASTDIVTTESNGLMSKEDKNKLDEMSTGATILALPAEKIVQNETHRFVTDSAIKKWNTIAGVELATSTSNGLMSADDKTKLNGIAPGANNYKHPETHLPEIIKQDVDHKFVSDVDIARWNDKATKETATSTNDGLMAKEDKVKLTGIEERANHYVHPDMHPASMIKEDETHRFVTDEEKAKLENLEELIRSIVANL